MQNIYDRLIRGIAVFLLLVLIVAGAVLFFGDTGSNVYDTLLMICGVLVLLGMTSTIPLSGLSRRRREAWQQSVLTPEHVWAVIQLQKPFQARGKRVLQHLFDLEGVGPYSHDDLVLASTGLGSESVIELCEYSVLIWDPELRQWELTSVLKSKVYEWVWKREQRQRRFDRRERNVA